MKSAILAFVVAAVSSAWAQPALTPPSPAIPAPPSPASTPGLPASPVAPGLPGFSTGSSSGNGFTNSFGNNFSAGDLGGLLVNLQLQIEQTLPLLASFNNSVGFAGLNNNSTGTISGTVSTPVTTSGANLSSAAGANLSSRAGANISANLSTPAGGATAGNVAGSTFPPFATGVTNAFGFAPGFAPPANTNGFAAFPVNRDTHRALLILQNDMERLLPFLSAVNNGSSVQGLNAGFIPTGFTNSSGTMVPNSSSAPARTATPALSPTGR